LSNRAEIETALRRLAPKIPDYEFGAVMDHAMHSRGLRHARPEAAAWLSLVAFVRHTLTEYDDLLAQGYDEASARFFVAADMSAVLKEWGVRRSLTEED
jgi:hypothetical protein